MYHISSLERDQGTLEKTGNAIVFTCDTLHSCMYILGMQRVPIWHIRTFLICFKAYTKLTSAIKQKSSLYPWSQIRHKLVVN